VKAKQLKSRVKLMLLSVFVLCWAPAHADIISYSDSGTFTAATPSDAFGFSGPSETWAFGFQADRNPVVLESGMGGFNFAFSDFSYSLDGSPVAITPTFIRFFSATNGGGFAICFNGATVGTCTEALATATFGWPQMYRGTTAAPTLLTGAFTTDFAALVSSNAYAQPNTTVQATSAVPEPSTLLTIAAALLALGVRRLYSRRAAFR
jgi:hypothetical protein